jgi:hypothetical protein
MMSTRRSARSSATGEWVVLGLSALVVLMPVSAFATVVDTFYERAVMTAADERCRLFSPQVASALAAGRAQARGAALRAGVAPEALATTETRARAKARSSACNSPEIAGTAERIRASLDVYARQAKEVYPGEVAGWTAERYPSARTPIWSLSQPVAFGPDRMTFGLAAQNGKTALLAVTDFADGAEPYTARLIIRDTARARQPYFDRRQAGAGGKLPLSARTAPRSTTRTFLAEARAGGDPRLAPRGAKGALAFRFPAEAASAIAGLDPREAIEVEFAFAGRGGDIVRRAFIEVGDFAAGQAFLAIAPR